jgi:hydrogenase expression/formation protein HypE
VSGRPGRPARKMRRRHVAIRVPSGRMRPVFAASRVGLRSAIRTAPAFSGFSAHGGLPILPRDMATGKIAPEMIERLIAPHLGAAREEILLGPRPGVDAAVIRIGAGRVMVVTTDPLSLIPALGPERSAWLACHLVASDLWTTGIPPAYASVNLNLPPDLDDATLGAYLRAMGEAWAGLGVAVVTGHTGRALGCALPIVGAATLIGVGDESRSLGPAFVAAGDRVIVTKGCAIEATAIAAHLFPRRLAAALDEDGLARARAMLAQVSVVADCRAAIAAGVRENGVSMMHDATEGGVAGALVETARASGHDLRIERAKVPLSDEARAACAAFGIDPWWALSEGTLIVCARPARSGAVLAEMAEAGIAAADAGEVVPGDGAVWMTEPDGSVTRIAATRPDPYWDAYARAVREGWS